MKQTFKRMVGGKVEYVDADGKVVEQAEHRKSLKAFAQKQDQAMGKASDSEGQEPDDDQPALKTGDLPHNIVGAAKLKEGGVTTYEQLREKSKADLVALGLSDGQADKALAAANKEVE